MSPYRAHDAIAPSAEVVVRGDAWLPAQCLKCACAWPLVSRRVSLGGRRAYTIPLCPRCDGRRELVWKLVLGVSVFLALGCFGVVISRDPGPLGGAAMVAVAFGCVYWGQLRNWRLRVRALPDGRVGLRDVHRSVAQTIALEPSLR